MHSPNAAQSACTVWPSWQLCLCVPSGSKSQLSATPGTWCCWRSPLLSCWWREECGWFLPKSTMISFVLEMFRIELFISHQSFHLLFGGLLISVPGESHYCWVVCKLHNGVGGGHGTSLLSRLLTGGLSTTCHRNNMLSLFSKWRVWIYLHFWACHLDKFMLAVNAPAPFNVLNVS